MKREPISPPLDLWSLIPKVLRTFPLSSLLAHSEGLENAEACNAISKADFKSKSFIALKEARESLYWIDLLHRNDYLDDKQYKSIYNDADELEKERVVL